MGTENNFGYDSIVGENQTGINTGGTVSMELMPFQFSTQY